jgi:hypothetical protein
LGSFQFEFNIPDGYILEDIKMALEDGYFVSNIQGNNVKLLWYKNVAEPIELKSLQTLFSLILRKIFNPGLGFSELTLSGFQEVNNGYAVSYQNVKLVAPLLKSYAFSNAFDLYPNPTHGPSKVGFNLLADAYLSGFFTDAAGKIVKEVFKNRYITRGFSELDVDLSDLQSGLYYFHVQGIPDQHTVITKVNKY